jgi:ABC-2 type transport system permease protein
MTDFSILSQPPTDSGRPREPSGADGAARLAASTPEPVNEGRLFWRLRWRLFRNAARQMLGQTTVRPVTVLVACVGIWFFVFAISIAGFHFLQQYRLPVSGGIVGMLFALMFLTLGGMLVFSTGLILYGSLFTSAETGYLLSKPVRADQVFAYKFQGALAFSSSAFLLLGSPLLVAYGLVCDAPWFFYLYLPLFFLGFVLLPGSLGALACLLLVNFLPRRRKQVVALVLGLIAVVVTLWILDMVHTAPDADRWTREGVSRLLGRFRFAGASAMPSRWVAEGLQAAGRGRLKAASTDLALVWSNGLFFYLLTAWASAGLYRRGFNRVATGGTLRKRYGGRWMDRLLERLLFFVRPTTRLLIVKDFRTFRREPQQWAQVLIFSSLIALYMMNIRRMFLFEINWTYRNGISLLNLTAISLLVSIYTGRFIFPMLSLEGRKMWLLGLLPLKRDELLWGKFAFSTTGALLFAEFLVVLSDIMLEMPGQAVALHALTVLVIAAGLSGLSVGMGALMPNFRETDPSKIAVGFGGTLNLVLSLGFLVAVVLLMALPWHMAMYHAGAPDAEMPHPAAVLAAAVLGIAFGAVAVTVPLRLGIRALRAMEI